MELNFSILEKYDLGTPLPSMQGTKSETCNYIINSKNKKSGEVMTPTYPGTYPKDIQCSYKFVGMLNFSTIYFYNKTNQSTL